MKKKSRKSVNRKQLLILVGCILLAILAYILIPAELGGDEAMNELELHDAMSRAADGYMLASNEEERQTAARAVRSIRAGNNPGATGNRVNPMSVLRGILILAIVVLAYRIFRLFYPDLRLIKTTQV